MVERGEAARDVERLVIGGGRGGDQAEMLGDGGQRRQQRERFERRGCGAALQRVHRHVQEGQMVRHEQRIEPALLQLAGEPLVVREAEVRVREGARIAPRAGMDTRRPQEGAEAELAWSGHAVASSFLRSAGVPPAVAAAPPKGGPEARAPERVYRRAAQARWMRRPASSSVSSAGAEEMRK